MKIGGSIVSVAYLAIGAALFGGIIWAGGSLARDVNQLVGLLVLLLGIPFGVVIMRFVRNALNGVLKDGAKI